MRSADSFLRLGDGVYLKRLEFPAVYNTLTDDIYEVDPAGFDELARCDGALRTADSRFPAEFLEFCLEEGVLAEGGTPSRREVLVGRNEVPSLRYLMVEITDRCNLDCLHCYLGDTTGAELGVDDIESVLEEFESIGGLRLVVTGGEPTLHLHFDHVNELASGRAFRSILVTNATLIDDRMARAIGFHEVQVSLDGMRSGHDYVRGEGSFDAALAGIENLRRAGKAVSIATMVHGRDLDQLDELESLVERVGAVSWTLDVPCEAGRMAGGSSALLPDLARAAGEMGRAFGSEQHQPSGDWTCGAHLAFLKASGILTKCGFYDDWNGGPVADGLRAAWLRMPRMKLADLDCDCEFVAECGGGCRFRAETTSARTGPDPVKCLQFGVFKT